MKDAYSCALVGRFCDLSMRKQTKCFARCDLRRVNVQSIFKHVLFEIAIKLLGSHCLIWSVGNRIHSYVLGLIVNNLHNDMCAFPSLKSFKTDVGMVIYQKHISIHMKAVCHRSSCCAIFIDGSRYSWVIAANCGLLSLSLTITNSH